MPAAFALRPATPDDETAVGALLAASYPALMAAWYPAEVLAAALPAMTRANPRLLASGTFYVAETARGTLLGCGGWTRERPGSGDVVPGLGHVRHFATHPAWTGRAIGRAIFERCERDARAADVRRFACYASLNAEGFYAALGFAPLRRIALPIAEGLAFPAILMQKAI